MGLGKSHKIDEGEDGAFSIHYSDEDENQVSESSQVRESGEKDKTAGSKGSVSDMSNTESMRYAPSSSGKKEKEKKKKKKSRKSKKPNWSMMPQVQYTPILT